MSQTAPEPAITVKPRTWSVEVEGKHIGSVSQLTSSKWIALYGLYSKTIGNFDSKDEAVAAVLAYTEPVMCLTCGQAVK